MIFCVEDDPAVRELILYALRGAGFEARGLEDGEALFRALAQGLPELVLLDIMLPGEDGLTILKRLRAAPETAGLPVIMTTARGAEYDKVLGLDLGADDYLAKPFGMMEMLSRVRAVLRRSGRGAPTAQPLCAGGLVLDPERHTVTADGARVELTLKEYELLFLLLRHPGRAFTREQLLRAVWQTDYAGETRTVDVHINTLRAKLGGCGGCIQTVRGVGYRLEATL